MTCHLSLACHDHNLCFCIFGSSHKSRVKGHLRLKMTYLPKDSGSEKDPAEQNEEPDVSPHPLTRPHTDTHNQSS